MNWIHLTLQSSRLVLYLVGAYAHSCVIASVERLLIQGPAPGQDIFVVKENQEVPHLSYILKQIKLLKKISLAAKKRPRMINFSFNYFLEQRIFFLFTQNPQWFGQKTPWWSREFFFRSDSSVWNVTVP